MIWLNPALWPNLLARGLSLCFLLSHICNTASLPSTLPLYSSPLLFVLPLFLCSLIAMPTRCRWSDSEDRTLINVLLEEKKAGNQSDNGWKKVVWMKAGTRLTDEHPGVQNKKTAAKCLEHYSKVQPLLFLSVMNFNIPFSSQLKKKYKQLQCLKDLSGFGWDNERKMVTATDAVWQPCINVSPTTYFSAHVVQTDMISRQMLI